MTCYHMAMAEHLDDPERFNANPFLYPEEARWLMTLPHPACDGDCPDWPRFTVVPGSPHPPYYPEPEIYEGFRSDPRPLLGVLRLR